MLCEGPDNAPRPRILCACMLFRGEQVVVGPGGFMFDDRVNPDSLPEDIEFREEVLDCFPEADSHHGYPLPEHLPQVRERGAEEGGTDR